MKIYDVLGNEVTTLVDEYKSAGRYNVQFTINKEQLSSGLYFYQIRFGKFSDTKKMIFLKVKIKNQIFVFV
ncbi:MAG: T9SS type A sorting domain-containing protein [Ignavibacteriales bacterium]|nr:T9SS type A sorting domain-containing protein [Ignavibacteriales bacterium]